MARIRSIKPELWQDERIGTLPRDARLLFIGLISHADDEGRLRGNPLLLRAQVFPYDPSVDVDGGLAQLEQAGAIVRYVADGQAYVWIRNFRDHQRIEKPKDSDLPAPPTNPRLVHDSSTTHPGTVVDESGMSPGRNGVEGNGEEGNGADAVAELQVAWNELTSAPIPQWQETGKARRKAALAALKRRPLEQWKEVFRRIGASRFCRGETDGGWRADPDWALRAEGTKPEPASKVLEGKFDDAPVRAPPAKSVGRSSVEGPCSRCGAPATGVTWGHALCSACHGQWLVDSVGVEDLEAFTASWARKPRAA